MNVLVACEESQRVCLAFRSKGHNAFSCDLLPCSGGYPEFHIQGDVLKVLNSSKFVDPFMLKYGIRFYTQNSVSHFVEKWDLIIAHPPCDFLTLSGNRWFNVERYGNKARDRLDKRVKAIDFFMHFVYCSCDRVAIENPIGVMSTFYRKPDQIIQPYQFALSEEERTVKSTCLWLKNLPLLDPIYTKKPDIKYHTWIDKNGKVKRQSYWYYSTRCLPHSQRALFASKTFPGIALAMAEQWG